MKKIILLIGLMLIMTIGVMSKPVTTVVGGYSADTERYSLPIFVKDTGETNPETGSKIYGVVLNLDGIIGGDMSNEILYQSFNPYEWDTISVTNATNGIVAAYFKPDTDCFIKFSVGGDSFPVEEALGYAPFSNNASEIYVLGDESCTGIIYINRDYK